MNILVDLAWLIGYLIFAGVAVWILSELGGDL